jgi:predicted helicase
MANIGEAFREHLCSILGATWSDKIVAGKVNPMTILYYVTAITFSQEYRVRYSELLRRDFPKIPIISNKDCVEQLVDLGKRVTDILAFEKLTASPSLIKFPVEGNDIVENGFPTYDSSSERVYINKVQFFEGVSQPVWDYEIGGRKPCFEWLKARRKANLSYDQKKQYERIAASISELISLSEQIDETLSRHWKDVSGKLAVGKLI